MSLRRTLTALLVSAALAPLAFAAEPIAMPAELPAFAPDKPLPVPEVARRKMFGFPAIFVGGNLVSGLYEDAWLVRLPDEDRTELLTTPLDATLHARE